MKCLLPKVRTLVVLVAGLAFLGGARAQMPVFGDYSAHDPSTMIKDGNRYYIFRTSQGIMGKYSTDLRSWTYGGQVFPGAPPAWTTSAVPGFTGLFWAPDVAFFSGKYHLYYACSTFGSQVSAIGLVITTNLSSGPWIDQGPVIQSAVGDPYNCIDPSILLVTNGSIWMGFGSYWIGLFLLQLDPSTGKRISPNSPLTRLASNGSIEASCLYQRSGYYYLFVNWGSCCSGVDSTYNIRVGRSPSVTGPYLDRNGVNMVAGGGSMFLESTARFVGPGHAGILNDNGTNWFTYHYYDGNNSGAATLGLAQLNWSADGWPVLTNVWSAFYTFNTDAREHLGLYNGTLQGSAAIRDEPARGQVLSLDGVSGYARLVDPVANASTFAAWVKWNGGAAWQRIFDFGDGTSAYGMLTPSANSGKMRFAIRTSGSGAEQIIEAPVALPVNSWRHVAVALDGSTGWLYLDGKPLATNLNLTIRPWQTLARSNYIGKSQFADDPLFNGRIDSFRVFSRALSPSEIAEVASAHPALAHRYSFNSNTSLAWDSLGMAHGTLLGNAISTSGTLKLTGLPGGYVNLPGGLVSGSSAATIEFWASFGANGNRVRVFDFGDRNGANGAQYAFFSPHPSPGAHCLEISTNVPVNLSAAGALDNRALHVSCIIDPENSWLGIYTNGILETARTNPLPPLSGVSAACSFLGRSLFSADPWLNANIDEFRIYDRRLTAQEITANELSGPDALPAPASSPAACFTVPLMQGQDPAVEVKDGIYHLVQSDGCNIRLRRSVTLGGLATAANEIILSPGCSDLWAPEIHWLNNRWYLYYSLNPGSGNRGFVAESQGADPAGPYTIRGILFNGFWNIDGSVFTASNGQLYYTFSGNPAGTQNIYIAPMSNPYTLSATPVMISQPTQPWETIGAPPAVNEGPFGFTRKGRTFIVYSASGCWTDDYCLGLLSLSGANPLDPGAWTKSGPVFTQQPGAYGPGHNGVFTDPHGQWWNVYHANNLSGQGCGGYRQIRIQRLGWDANNSPVFGAPVPTGSLIVEDTNFLVARFPLDETNGTTAASLGCGPAATVSGGSTWANPGLKLNGTNGFVDCGAASGNDVQQALTLAAWIRGENFVDWAGIISKGVNTAPYAMQVWSNGALRFSANWGSPGGSLGGGSWNSTTTMSLRQWYHVAVTYDGDRVRFYINGVLDSNQPAVALRFGVANEPLILGADFPGNDEYFNGVIRDAAVYGRALTRDEIVALANVNLAPQLAPLADVSAVAGQFLAIQATATDPNLPPQTLRFSLVSGPDGANVNPLSGYFTWGPTLAQAPSTNLVTLAVTDNGTPPLSATRSFTVTVRSPVSPTLSMPREIDGLLNFDVNGDPGPNYALWTSTNLQDWTLLWVTNSPSMPFRVSVPFVTNAPASFYRVQVQ